MMKLWLIIFDISSLVSNGFAIVSAPNPSTAQLTLMTQGSGNLKGYNITGILELGVSKICLIRILTEGITSRGELGAKGDKGDKGDRGILGIPGSPGSKGEKGDKGDTGAAFTYDMFTPELLESLKGPKGDKGDSGVVEITDDFYITTEGKLAINKTTEADKDNTKPITSGGVYNIVGNIDSLLLTI